MNECVLPCSPNWFSSSVSSGNEAGLYAFGAKNHVYVYDLNLENESVQSQFLGEDESRNLSHKVPRLIKCYTEHEHKVSAVCLSPDPEQQMCCSADETFVNLWDIPTGTTMQTHNEHKDKITCMTWSPCDLDLVLSASERGTVVLWKLKTKTVTLFQPQKDYICCIKASPHSSALVAIGYRSGAALIINIELDQPRIMQKLRGFEMEITSICWCPVEGDSLLEIAAGHSGTLVAAAGGRLIKIWDSNTGKDVFYKRLQSSSNFKVNSQDPTTKKQWLDIQWPKSNPSSLISSSSAPHGDLCLWNLNTRTQQEPVIFDSSSINKHMRLIFNITLVGDRICTFSLDRIIAVWDLKSCKGLVSWSSFGGYPHCIRASPLDPGMVAIGAGDNTVRVWNQNNKSKPFDITCLCYGARSMITTVAWHPEREGLLAFGTDDGRVGVMNTLTIKHPLLSTTFHKRTVYVVCWGPPVRAHTGSPQYQVYSVGDGTVLQHFIGESGSNKDAVNLIDAINSANNLEGGQVVRSEIIWKRDYTAFAIGCDNGSVCVYSFPSLKQVFTIKTQQKMINCVRWHPEMTSESLHDSPCQNWIAIAGNDRHISVVDLPSLFDVAETNSSMSPITITEAFCQLPGHVIKTTDMSWSPHHDGQLVSVGYDRIAIVWNVKSGECLASYSGHHERVLTVLWSYLDPDLIMTGGCDSTLRVWRVSTQSKTAIDIKDRKKKRKKFTVHNSGASSFVDSVSKSNVLSASEQEIEELQVLLLAKQQQLMSQFKLESATTDLSAAETVDCQLPDNRDHMISDRYLSSEKALSVDSIYRPPHMRANTTLDSPITSTISTTLPLKDNSAITITRESSTIGSTLIVLANNQTSPLSSTNGDQSDLVSVKRLSSFVNVAGEVVAENENSNNENNREFIQNNYNSVLSVTDLVVPVRPLFPKSGYNNSTAKSTDFLDKFRKRKLKSFFPVSSSANNRGKTALHEDILDLSRVVTGQGPADLIDNKPHLGLFTDRLGAHRCLLQESEHHLNNDNMEYHLQLELWRGNVAGAIQIARQRNQLSDWIVSMAPLASHDLWELVSSEYAEQLEDDGQYHKAATYLLAAHKVYQAIDLFKRHKLFKEAVSLARIRLSTTDPVLEDLYTDWSQNLMKEGQYEQAAKCYLAMRQIQEASKVLTRRLDQSSLKTACHLSLLGNEKQQGLTLAYKLFNQYLMMGQWQEAQEFIAEHESLKILLPILHVHRLVIQHLTTLCPSMVLTFKQVTPDMFSQWEKTEQNRKKTELPEFLLDKSEIDPVVPWEPFLIEEHTFPHHVLRVWHQHLDITMVTQDLKAMHATISQVMPHRHNMVDLPSLLVLITVDITLCLLSLLTSETSSAIVHLLQAMSTLHQSHHTSLQQALCRLMLPLGPKYLLKLQKEFNASRVLITMESNGDMDKAGGESHNSIKKFLTDIKDDNTISMSSVRCRELDCLRAYCYLSVLDYLGDRLPGPQIENDSLDGMPNGKLNADKKTDICTNTITENKLPIKMAENPAGSSHGVHPASLNSSDSTISNRDDLEVVHNQNMSSLDQNGKMNQSKSSVSQHFMGNGDRYQVIFDSFSKVSDVKLEIDDKQDRLNVVNTSCNNSAISQELVPSSLSSSQPSLPKSSPVSSSVDPPVPSNIPTLILSPLKRAARDRSSTDALEALSSSYTSSSSSMKTTADSSGRTPEEMEKLSRIPPEATASLSCQTVDRSHLNYWRLLHLSKGILWDVQAKREALTETLGYIHKAISQHLLFNRSADGNDHCDEDVKDLNPSINNNSKCLQHAVSTDLEEDGGCHRTRLLSTSPSSHHSEEASLKPEINSAMSEHHTSNIPCQSSRATSSMNSSSLELAKSRTPSTVPLENVAHISLVRSFSENFASLKSTLNASSKLEKSLALQVEQALHGAMKSQPIALQNSRKVLWMDGQETCSHADPTSCDSTFQISKMSPDGSVIPLEWDSLSVDIKYSMPYVTLPLLRQEQESISQELKKVPDSSKIPFPMTATSVKKLVLTSSASHNLSQSEKKIYLKQLYDWAAVFAVTSHQQRDMEALFADAE